VGTVPDIRVGGPAVVVEEFLAFRRGRVSPAHDRMPVILPPASHGEWLDPQTREARLVSLLKPYPADEMQVAEVGPAVNSPKNDRPECLDAA
jgi:putative SOS response-associated peptidase YedK